MGTCKFSLKEIICVGFNLKRKYETQGVENYIEFSKYFREPNFYDFQHFSDDISTLGKTDMC